MGNKSQMRFDIFAVLLVIGGTNAISVDAQGDNMTEFLMIDAFKHDAHRENMTGFEMIDAFEDYGHMKHLTIGRALSGHELTQYISPMTNKNKLTLMAELGYC